MNGGVVTAGPAFHQVTEERMYMLSQCNLFQMMD